MIRTLILAILLIAPGANVDAHDHDNHVGDFEIAGVTVAPGSRADFEVPVPAGDDDPATVIPMSVLHGARPGPVLLVVAGVHGYEFSPILAAARLADTVDPADLSGTLAIVRLAHVAAFEHRVPYVNPYDRKNLNRSFPGKADGSQTERVAWALSTQVIPNADFVMDVHSGDGAEWLAAFVGVYGGPLASEYPTALAVARAMGFPNIVRYRMQTREQVDRRRSLNRQAVAAGLPTVLVEIGQNGSRDPKQVLAIVAGIRRALATLGMTAADDSPPGHAAPRLFDGTRSVPVSHNGIWTPAQPGGRWIEQGEELGVVQDYAGNIVEVVRAPADGYAIYGLAGPPVRSGESVMTIAQPVDSL